MDTIDLGIYVNVDATAAKPKGVTANYLLKIWSINKETADRVIKCTTQLKKKYTDGNISRNFSTNDRMLRYKWINSQFFTNTLHAKKGCKSAQCYIHCQLFVSYKGFVYTVPMKNRGDFPWH